MTNKGSVFFTAVILFSILGILLLVGLQSDFGARRAEDISEDQTTLSNLGSYTELMKKFSYHALRDGSVVGAFQNALYGAGDEWWKKASCDGSPMFEETRETLETESQSHANAFLMRTSQYDFGGIRVKQTGDFHELQVMVEKEDVYAGENDEDYRVHGESYEDDDYYELVPFVLETSDGVQNRSFFHDYVQQVSPVRFWYMWRIIKEWSQMEITPQLACEELNGAAVVLPDACLGTCTACGGCPASADPFVSQAVQQLENMFDDDVECDYVIEYYHCEKVDYGVEPHHERLCEFGCKENECYWVPTTNYCYSEDGREYQFDKGDCEFEDYDDASCGGCCAPCHGNQMCYSMNNDNRFLELAYEVTCTDNKYQSPVEKDGFDNLDFIINDHISLVTDKGPVPPPECCPPDDYALVDYCCGDTVTVLDPSCAGLPSPPPSCYSEVCTENCKRLEAVGACSTKPEQSKTFTWTDDHGAHSETRTIGCGMTSC